MDEKFLREILTDTGSTYDIYCPICRCYISKGRLKYDNEKYDQKELWIRAMIKHYTHEHIGQSKGGLYRQKAREIAKRQILKYCKDFLVENGFSANDFLMLNNNRPNTIRVVDTILGQKKE